MSGRISLLPKLGLSLCLAVVAVRSVAEARTLTLAARSELRPVGWRQGNTLWFAPGAGWADDFDGGVQSGTLDQTASLQVWNSSGKVDFGLGFIRFERAGGVKEGTLAADATLNVVNTAAGSKFSLAFKGGTTVEFGYDGGVMKGTLAHDEPLLKTSNGESKSYPRGTLVDFDGAGLVTRAVLPAGAPTPLDGSYTGTCTIIGIGTFPFAFQAAKGSFSGAHNVAPYSLQWQGNYGADGNLTNGLMAGWVDVGQGAQKRWTVRGPIRGTIAAAGAAGTLSITSADGASTWTGTWSAAKAVAGTRLTTLRHVPEKIVVDAVIEFEIAVDQAPASASYLWDFGDAFFKGQPCGSTAVPRTNYSWNKPGTYTVVVSVMDKVTRLILDKRNWTVEVAPALPAGWDAGPTMVPLVH